MAIAWTEEQSKVIGLRDRSLLVSAAAGSGKTAVLVERILKKVTDPARPLDLDRLLVMTFTRAAAGEMKERLRKALEREAALHPEDDHLLRQQDLVHTARITTIDGFCADLLHNYFHLIDLDPSFRTAEEGELKLLREDVMDEMLQEEYANRQEDFLWLVETFAPGRDDTALGDLIQNVYDVSRNAPYPEAWFAKCREAYPPAGADPSSPGAAGQWLAFVWEDTARDLEDALECCQLARNLCQVPGGPFLYEEGIREDYLAIQDLVSLCQKKDFDGLRQALEAFAPAALSRKKMEADPDLKDRVKDLRQEYKELLKGLEARCFSGSLADFYQSLSWCGRPIRELLRLAEAFAERFSRRKREKNLLDFADMEHLALRILQSPDGERTAASRELSLRFDEILIDEYQDSNLVQEYIAQAVSGWVDGRENIFMVGDVKQSIYRFRLARPDLFLEKYATYSRKDGPRQRIDLHQNFRSRSQVLDLVNDVFRRIMCEDLGRICYDDAAALYAGANFPALPPGHFQDDFRTELILLDTQDLGQTQGEDEEGAALTARELEAHMVARRIQAMVGHDLVWDKDLETYRPLRLGDIAILLRTGTGWAEVFTEVFSERGIPTHTASRTGYFSAVEVVHVLDLLRLLDNPRQDIPLAGVLLSPIVGLDGKNLAILRAAYPEGLLYDALLAFLENPRPQGFPLELEGRAEETLSRLHERLSWFLRTLEGLRDLAPATPIHSLISLALSQTGFGDYVQAMPDGDQRGANLRMLVEKAREFEKTSYSGLFSFLRYIDHLQKYEVDFGQVDLASAQESTVQIMTIHKSKGLEFPVVFVCGLGKSFNFQDIRQPLLIHADHGLAMDVADPLRRTRRPSLMKGVLARRLKEEMLGEELRVLYVAMTRAKEKLILTGAASDLEKRGALLAGLAQEGEGSVPFRLRSRARTYLDYLLPALAGHSALRDWYHSLGLFPQLEGEPGEEPPLILTVVQPKDLISMEKAQQADRLAWRKELEDFDPERVYDQDLRTVLEERFAWAYPWEKLGSLPVKLSVSELKKRSWQDPQETEEGENLFFAPDVIPLVPSFIQEQEEELAGADRGTAYHRVMECLDYRELPERKEGWESALEEALGRQLEEMVDRKLLSPLQAQSVRVGDLGCFLATPLGSRMQRAGRLGLLKREQPFVFSQKARDLDPEAWPFDETILVQGIIDAYFLEEGDLVLVDYKTDRIGPGQEQVLAEKYHIQLEDYAQALERLTGRKVKERYLYSFALGKEIPV